MRLILLIFLCFIISPAASTEAADAPPASNFQKLLVINRLQAQKQELEGMISQQTADVYQDNGQIPVTAYVTEINLCQSTPDSGECIDNFTIAEKSEDAAVPDKILKVSVGDSFSDGEGTEIKILDSSPDRLKIEISGVFDNGREHRKKVEIIKGAQYNFALSFSDSAYYTLIDADSVK